MPMHDLLVNITRKKVQIHLQDGECVTGELVSFDSTFLEVKCAISGAAKVKYINKFSIKYVEEL